MKAFIDSPKKFISFFVAAIAAVGLTTGCYHGGDSEERTQKTVERISTKLNLNETQRQKLVEVKDAIVEARKRNKTELESIMKEVKNMVLSDKLDINKAKDLIERRENVMEREFNPIFDKIAAFHATLTPDQKKELVTHLEKMHCPHKDHENENNNNNDNDD